MLKVSIIFLFKFIPKRLTAFGYCFLAMEFMFVCSKNKGRTHPFIPWENKLLQLSTKDFEVTERVVTFPFGRCG